MALGSTFIPCPKSYNQTQLGFEFLIKRNPYTKRILITKENIKLSSVTDRDTIMNQSATSTFSSRVIGRLTYYSHQQTPASVISTSMPSPLDLVIFGCFPIGNHLHRQLPCRPVTIAPSTDPYSRHVSKDTRQKNCVNTISSSSLKGARNSIGNINTILTSGDGPFPLGSDCYRFLDLEEFSSLLNSS